MSKPPCVADERQKQILKLLTERSAVHAGLYAAALRELDSPPASGFESTRVAVFCHCARELMLGALDLLVDTPEPRQKPSSGSLARDLPSVLARHAGLDLRADQDLIPVPSEVAAAFANLVDTSTRETGRNKRNTAALVTGHADGSHPSVSQWSKTYAFFVAWAHVDQHHSGSLPDDMKLTEHLRVVEDVIEVRMNLFFDNLSVVDDILALANEMDGISE